jgi:hypothetical protein
MVLADRFDKPDSAFEEELSFIFQFRMPISF